MLVSAAFVAGVVVIGATVFVVREHTIEFRNRVEYITNPVEVRAQLNAAIHPYVFGSNILFNLDREQITEVIELNEPRVRVTNIEVHFPNRVEITIRERYPQFVYRRDGRVLILDGQLRIVDDRELPRSLIDISDQIDVPVGDAQIGNYLFDYLPFAIDGFIEYNNQIQMTKMQRLIDAGMFFGGRGNYEDSLNHLFSTIEFCNLRGEIDVRFVIREVATEGRIRNEIHMYNVECQELFFEKLASVMWALEQRPFPGIYRVFQTESGRIRVVSPVDPSL